MLSHRVSLVKPSPTLAITSKAISLINQGIDVVSLSAGEPDFDTPVNIKNAGIKAINEGKTKYTAVDGIKQLKEAIQAKLHRENNLDYQLNEIVVANGAKQVIYNALMSIINKDDEVIIPAPYWVSYPDMVLLAEGKPVFIDCPIADSFKLQPEKLKNAISKKTKLLILNSPSNPTGAVYSEAELKQIAEVLLDHPQVYILSDDIYEHIIFDHKKFFTLAQVEPKLKQRTLTVNGLSKSYSMTGWRIGYGAGPKEIIEAMVTVQSQSTSNASSISQFAAVEGLNGDQTIIKTGKELFQKRRDLVIDLLKEAPGLELFVPEGAFYLFINCSMLIGKHTNENVLINSSQDFSSYLLDKHLVAVVPGEAFGANEHFRISYATSEEKLVKACERIVNACKEIMAL